MQQQQQQQHRARTIIMSSVSSPPPSPFLPFVHIFVNVSSVFNFAFWAFVALLFNLTSLHTRLGTLKSFGILGRDRMYSFVSGIGSANALDTISILLYNNNFYCCTRLSSQSQKIKSPTGILWSFVIKHDTMGSNWLVASAFEKFVTCLYVSPSLI